MSRARTWHTDLDPAVAGDFSEKLRGDAHGVIIVQPALVTRKLLIFKSFARKAWMWLVGADGRVRASRSLAECGLAECDELSTVDLLLTPDRVLLAHQGDGPHRVLALDRDRGDLVWERPTGMYSTVGTDGKTVWFSEDDADECVARDVLTGRELWRRPHSQVSMLATCDDHLIIADGRRLTGLDPRTGDELWTVDVGFEAGFCEVFDADRATAYDMTDGHIALLEGLTGVPVVTRGKVEETAYQVKLLTEPRGLLVDDSGELHVLLARDGELVEAWRVADYQRAFPLGDAVFVDDGVDGLSLRATATGDVRWHAEEAAGVAGCTVLAVRVDEEDLIGLDHEGKELWRVPDGPEPFLKLDGEHIAAMDEERIVVVRLSDGKVTPVGPRPDGDHFPGIDLTVDWVAEGCSYLVTDTGVAACLRD